MIIGKKSFATTEEEKMREAYEDWIKLLENTKNTDLLKDPYNIWIEAWHVARATQSLII